MWNVCKSIHYAILRDIWFVVLLIATLLVPVLELLFTVGFYHLQELTGSEYFAEVVPASGMPFVFLSVMFLVSRVAGWDQVDKTINYEILSGKRKAMSYMGRTLLSILWALLIYFVQKILPGLVFTILHGWGNMCPANEIVLRMTLVMLPLMRMLCFMIFFIFLLRESMKAFILAVFCVLELPVLLIKIIMDALKIEKETFLWLHSNLAADYLTGFSNYSFDYVNGEDVQVVKSFLQMNVARQIVIVSLVFSIIYLILGYVSFSKRDAR